LRILQLHSNFIEYQPVKKEIASAEKSEEEKHRLEELMVLFICVEKGDDEKTAIRAMDEVKESLDRLRVNRVLIYPYAHLSTNLAGPSDALGILKNMEAYSQQIGIETYRAPFGWCKQFSLSIKGHPLAEQLRIISPEEEKKEEPVSKALEAEAKTKSNWFILQPDGKLIAIDQFNFAGHDMLEKFAKYEISKVRGVQKVPPHVTLMRRLEIADYEPASDLGNFRWYPKGRLIKSLIEEFVTEKVIEYGGMEVETPIMYDFQHPSLSDYVNRFPARQYLMKSEDKELFLRFSACFGQFLMVHDAQLSYRQLPLRIYELTKYSFRREKSGELAGLRRLRAFTMPDCHAMCTDLEQAKQEFLTRFKLSKNVLEGLGLTGEDYELAVRFTKDFYQQNKDSVLSLVQLFGKPALVEMWHERFFYFVLKWEFNFVDSLEKASALSTDQIDIENAERYGITYTDEKGGERHPLVLHCSPSGAIERDIYAMLEKAHMEQNEGRPPTLPLWLSPTQVRVVPISERFYEGAGKVAEKIESNRIRVDLDDRPLTMQRKVREAEMEWIPYIVVIGEREVGSEILTVRERTARKAAGTEKLRRMKLEDLADEIRSKTDGKPFKPLTLSKTLSNRPRFFG